MTHGTLPVFLYPLRTSFQVSSSGRILPVHPSGALTLSGFSSMNFNHRYCNHQPNYTLFSSHIAVAILFFNYLFHFYFVPQSCTQIRTHSLQTKLIPVHPFECSQHMSTYFYFFLVFVWCRYDEIVRHGLCWLIQVYFNVPARTSSSSSSMARRRKNRTHLKGPQSSTSSLDNVPKSFVIKHGQVGTSLTQLTRDIRKVMEPNTATRLKVCLFSSRPFLVSSMDADTAFFRPSKGTLPEQAQGLFDHGASAARHASPRFHVDGCCAVDAHRASVEWPDAQLPHRAL